MVKYADSFEATTTHTTASQTKYTRWFDASWANELYSFATIAGTKTITTTMIATIQRYSPIVSTGTDIASHTGLSATGSNEKVVSAKPDGDAAYGADNQFGTRVRWKCVTDGTWTSGQTLTTTLVMYAKRN